MYNSSAERKIRIGQFNCAQDRRSDSHNISNYMIWSFIIGSAFPHTEYYLVIMRLLDRDQNTATLGEVRFPCLPRGII